MCVDSCQLSVIKRMMLFASLMILLKKYPPAGFEIYIAQYVVLNKIITCIFSDIFKPAGGFLD